MIAAPLNLQELALRESEQVEWKENVVHPDDVVETLSAFANDFANLGGGYVVCGAREERDEYGFARVRQTGLTAARLKELENVILTRCRERVDPPISPIVHEVPSEDPSRRCLVFVMPSTSHAHSFRRDSDSGKFYIRLGRSTREARNGLYRELLVRKRDLEPWDRRPHREAGLEDIDLLVLRDTLQRMSLWDQSRSVDDYLSDRLQLADLVPPLCAREPLTGVLRPRNFTLLLFGRQPTRFFPGAYAIYSRYAGEDRSDRHEERLTTSGPLLEQVRVLRDRLRTQAYQVFDKKSSSAPNLVKYPERALDEALVNTLVHRDYEIDDPVRITVFADRVELYSPGSLPSRVDADRFLAGRPTPVWRNQSLAWFCIKLQLAQSEGQGVPTIFRAMHEEGCPPPRFTIESESVLCVLPANPRVTDLGGALALSVDAVFEPPARPEYAAVVRVPRVPITDLALRLRTVPIDREAWQTIMAEIDRGVESAVRQIRGVVHVHVMAPHAAAAYLGRRLDDLARARTVQFHQMSHDHGDWVALSGQTAPPANAATSPFYTSLDGPLGTQDSATVLLAIDGRLNLPHDELMAHGRGLGAAVYHLRSSGGALLQPEQSAEAMAALQRCLAHIHRRHPSAALHIITAAPAALTVELGRLLSPTIYRSAILYLYAPTSARYVPVIDVVARRVVADAAQLDTDAAPDIP